MTDDNLQLGKLLAEILRLQHWAGSDAALGGRIFGLMHGFESMLPDECESITKETQRKVEDVLQDIEDGKQSTDGLSIKQRLNKDDISESAAKKVMQLCVLQGRFTDAIKLVSDEGSIFKGLQPQKPDETHWRGALHYMEIYDTTEEAKKLHAVFSPCVPRVGEIVEPEMGSRMKVIGVEHVIVNDENPNNKSLPILIPHVLVEAIE